MRSWNFFLTALKSKLLSGLQACRFFWLFLTHRYSTLQFDLNNISHNVRILVRASGNDLLSATSGGRLRISHSFFQKFLFSLGNTLTFGALQKRVEAVVFFTFLTLTLELNNPFSQKILPPFLERKLKFLRRLVNQIAHINKKPINTKEIEDHIAIFHRTSILQAKIIKNMHQAVKRAKEVAIIKEAKKGLQKGLMPLLETKGISGTYWMRGQDRALLGLFKPFDEEGHAPHNPSGAVLRGALGLRKTRAGCRVGEAAHHEVAAYLVDAYFGFGIVPKTYYASFRHRQFFITREDRIHSTLSEKIKYGSFQEYVEGFVPIDQLTKEEVAEIPLDEFQLLIVLDLIIGNCDRHIGNILFGDNKIAAIDHGLSFTDGTTHLSCWYWSYFRQGFQPLLPAIKGLIDAFPFEDLSHKLHKRCFISWEALSRMRERVALFKEALNEGLVPAQLTHLFSSDFLDPLRDLEITLPESARQQLILYKSELASRTGKALSEPLQ